VTVFGVQGDGVNLQQLKEAVTPEGKKDGTDQIGDGGGPEVFNERDVVDAGDEAGNFAAKLGKEADADKKPEGVGFKLV